MDTEQVDSWPAFWKKSGLNYDLKADVALNWIQSMGFLAIPSNSRMDGTMITDKKVLTIKLMFLNQKLKSVILIAVPRA